MLQGVALLALVWPAWGQDNLLVNPSLDAGAQAADGWALYHEGRGGGGADWDLVHPHSLPRCLHAALTTEGDYYGATQRVGAPAQPGQVYVVGGWYRSDATGVAHPCVYYLNAAGAFMGAFECSLPPAPSWRPFERAFTPPEGTAALEVHLRCQGPPGQVWYDDLMLRPAPEIGEHRAAAEALFAGALGRHPGAVSAVLGPESAAGVLLYRPEAVPLDWLLSGNPGPDADASAGLVLDYEVARGNWVRRVVALRGPAVSAAPNWTEGMLMSGAGVQYAGPATGSLGRVIADVPAYAPTDWKERVWVTAYLGNVGADCELRVAWVGTDALKDDLLGYRTSGAPGAAFGDEAALQQMAEAKQGPYAQKALAVPRGEIRVAVGDPLQKRWVGELVERHALSKEPLPQAADLAAARGEAESFQVAVIGAGDRPLTAQATDLAGVSGRIPAAQVRVRLVETVQVHGQWLPDPLLEAQPFVAPAHGPMVLWVTVRVPRSARPGGYSGRLDIAAGGAKAAVPVRLHVWHYALPETTYLQSSFWLFRHTIRNCYGWPSVSFEQYRPYLDLALDARLAPIDSAEWHDQPYITVTRDRLGRYGFDWTQYDRYVSYCLAHGMADFNAADNHWFATFFRDFEVRDLVTGLVSRVQLDPKSRDYQRLVVQYFRELHEHLAKKGWADRAYLQAWDEPGSADAWAEIQSIYSLAREGYPGLRTLITAAPPAADQPTPPIGIWVPLTPGYDPAIAEQRRARGEEVWWYVCCGPTAPWANFFIDEPAVDHRLLFWQTWKYRSQGLLYWGLNHWPAYCARTMAPVPPEQRWPAVPWDDGGRNGDGYFIYPGPDGPLPSLRLEVMRDGVEDYDSFRMLDEFVARYGREAPPTLVAQARELLAVPDDIVRSMTDYSKDPDAVLQTRRQLGSVLSALSQWEAERRRGA